jgi:hypothetical protein
VYFFDQLCKVFYMRAELYGAPAAGFKAAPYRCHIYEDLVLRSFKPVFSVAFFKFTTPCLYTMALYTSACCSMVADTAGIVAQTAPIPKTGMWPLCRWKFFFPPTHQNPVKFVITC